VNIIRIAVTSSYFHGRGPLKFVTRHQRRNSILSHENHFLEICWNQGAERAMMLIKPVNWALEVFTTYASLTMSMRSTSFRSHITDFTRGGKQYILLHFAGPCNPSMFSFLPSLNDAWNVKWLQNAKNDLSSTWAVCRITILYVYVHNPDLHMAQQMPLPLTISCSSKSRLVLPFWNRLTWVVPDKIQKSHKTIVVVVWPQFLCYNKNKRLMSYSVFRRTQTVATTMYQIMWISKV